jgi:hypothetical protein
MLKEFVARVVLVLFIIGVTSEAAPDDGNSAPAKQPAAKDPAAPAPSETAN